MAIPEFHSGVLIRPQDSGTTPRPADIPNRAICCQSVRCPLVGQRASTGLRDLQCSRPVLSSPDIPVPLPGTAWRVAKRRSAKSSVPTLNALRKPRESPRRPTRCHDPREDAQATARHVSGRVLVTVQLEAASAATVEPLRKRLRNPVSAARAVLRRTGRENFHEGCRARIEVSLSDNQGETLGGGSLRLRESVARAERVADLQRFHCDEIEGVHHPVGEAVEFLPPRLLRNTERCFRRMMLRTAGCRQRSSRSPVDSVAKRRMPASSPTERSGAPVPTAGRTCSNRS